MPRHARDLRPPVLPLVVGCTMTAVVLAVAATLAAGGAGAVRALPAPVPTVAGAHLESPTPSPTPAPVPTRDPDIGFTVVAAGDVLPHMPVLRSARDGDGYDFGRLLDPLDPWVSGADLALCHLEVPIVPPGSAPSGYPVFGAPVQLAAGLADQGWDGCSTASNHSVDRGFAGVVATLDALDAAGLGHVGTARSALEGAQPQTYRLERGGRTVTVAHLAATYGTNGMPVEAGKPWSVHLIDADDLVRRAAAVRNDGADLVLVSLHWGTEYRTVPTDAQRSLAATLAESGLVDLVIGHHAHVPQSVEHLAGGPDGTGMWVAYGLGNYVSNQDEACCAAGTASGLLLTAEVLATGADPAAGTPAGRPHVAGVQWTPVTVDRRGGHRVHALTDVPAGAGALSAAQVAARLELVRAAAGPDAPERSVPAVPTGPGPVVLPRAR
ncbi:CapA family protein [Cellulomonas wangsupingiae]|uniref:CapA family protein n=1 Tax=Cellulomonas wangsupingiae TaxID=2968085 RepID=A0ABY5KDX1_9CELL|nr:CapA family protein [Cellulomonas wangsupingiae]MCC2335253.1 CapA family protein [Cellulomonas wangsupingiae]UUI66608.1 CapA family protein [Cellulomonas wangsupingiae]